MRHGDGPGDPLRESMIRYIRAVMFRNIAASLLFPLAALAITVPGPAQAQGRLQCVPYARSVSDIHIRGNAHTWWAQAAHGYERGHTPRVGAVLTFQSTRAMPLGHVAVVRQVLGERRILLDHANWSRPGMIERQALAVDVSDAGDWSKVRVWYGPSGSLGLRENPAFGFIYPASAGNPATDIAAAGKKTDPAARSDDG